MSSHGNGTALEVARYAHGKVPRELRERQVLELAAELFAERGYAGASMDELAARAGISKPVVYDLVGSKEELFRAFLRKVADELAETVASAVTGQHDPESQIRAGSLAFFRFVAEHRRTWTVLAEGGAFAEEETAIRRRQDDLVTALLSEAAEEPPDPLHVQALAHALNGAYEALALWWRDHPELSPETLADWLVELVLPGLEAMRRRTSPGA
jgi:AcrR family transcriptional regulator